MKESVDELAPTPEGAFENALNKLNTINALSRPTLPASASNFQIRLRLPGFEPHGSYTSIAPENVLCVDPTNSAGRQLLSANEIVEFSFGNSGEISKPFPYPTR